MKKQNFAKSSPKVRGRFRKILWPSQNILTLMESMDKGLKLSKWVLISRPKIHQMPQKISVQAQKLCLGVRSPLVGPLCSCSLVQFGTFYREHID